jgi:hypothetical protein
MSETIVKGANKMKAIDEKGNYCIYTLSDPIDKSVRYVGMSKSPYRRYGAHLTTKADPHNKAKKVWIDGLLERELLPILTIVERVTDRNQVYTREYHWIHFYCQNNPYLLNSEQSITRAKLVRGELTKALGAHGR